MSEPRRGSDLLYYQVAVGRNQTASVGFDKETITVSMNREAADEERTTRPDIAIHQTTTERPPRL